MLFLELYADLSDVEVAEQCRYNLLYRAFVGLPLGGPTPDDATLVVFRRRLGVERFRRLFDALVAQCQELCLLEGRLKIVDATHVMANVAIPNTVNLLREARRRFVGAIKAEEGEARPDLRERYRTDNYIRGIPTAEMLAASTHLGEEFLAESADLDGPRVVAARAILEQVLRPTAGRLSSVVDPEARLGHKTPTRRFIGYKLHVAEDTSELVTTVQVLLGNEHEGTHLPELLDEEVGKRVHQEALVADALYDSAANRAAVRRHGATPHIPRRGHRTRADRFTCDPAADALQCPRGHLSTHRTIEGTRTRFTEARRLPYSGDAVERARLLVNLGFATQHAGRVVPSVAGLLLFGAQPQDRLTAATLKCAFFYGQHQGTQLRDRADVVGPLHQIIDDGAVFVARNRRLVPRMEGIRRIDIPEYPDYSVREALANAVAHRDWSLEGAKVRLFMFDDRLEIWSPGRLPPPITLERLGYDQFSRNRLIARVLVERGYIEEVGLGIRRMREEMGSLGLPEPEFREDGFSFVITFRSIAPREGVIAAPDPFRALLERGEINERQYRGLLYLREHGEIHRREYVQVAGVSERTAARDLADLVEMNLLEPSEARGRSTAYRLRENGPA